MKFINYRLIDASISINVCTFCVGDKKSNLPSQTINSDSLQSPNTSSSGLNNSCFSSSLCSNSSTSSSSASSSTSEILLNTPSKQGHYKTVKQSQQHILKAIKISNKQNSKKNSQLHNYN
jgi:hypothetical protein